MNLGFGRKIWELGIGEWSWILFHNKNHVFEGKFEVFWKMSKDLRVINSKMVERFERYEFVSGFWFYFQKTTNFHSKLVKIWGFLENVERFESYEFGYSSKDLRVTNWWVEFDFIFKKPQIFPQNSRKFEVFWKIIMRVMESSIKLWQFDFISKNP